MYIYAYIYMVTPPPQALCFKMRAPHKIRLPPRPGDRFSKK